jgi:hypothetical protein
MEQMHNAQGGSAGVHVRRCPAILKSKSNYIDRGSRLTARPIPLTPKCAETRSVELASPRSGLATTRFDESLEALQVPFSPIANQP